MDEIKGIKTIHRPAVDPADPIKPINAGFFDETAAGRRMLTFVPDDVGPATAGVFVLPPSGVSAQEMAQRSNWVELAQTEECKERFIVFFLEAENGAWRTDEPLAAPGGETAYLQAAFDLGNERLIYGAHEAKFYLVGYGDGGVIAQKAAAENPAVYAGVAAVGSAPLDQGYLQETGASFAVDLGLFEDTDGLNIPRCTIPVPVFLIGEEPAEQLAQRPEIRYWRAAAGTEDSPRRRDRHILSFVRSKDTAYPIDQDKAAHRVWVGSYPDPLADLGNRLNRMIWKDFLYPVRRWMSEPGGSLRMAADPVRDLGCEYHYELVGGWMREWYVYVPRQVRQHPEIPVPVVFASHGYTCSGEIYLGNSGWDRVAEQEGSLVIAATGPYDCINGEGENEACKFENTQLPAWNIFGKPGLPDEIAFFRHMLEDVKSRYAVDEERVFATGHSWGSMMTQYLGMALPELFTAIAPCSGVLFDEHDRTLLKNPQLVQNPRQEVPVWMFVGQREPWLFPHLPEGDNTPARSIRLWWQRNRMEGPPPASFQEGWRAQGRWNDLFYDKQGRPMLRYSWVRNLPHATMPEMSWRIWREFFSGLRKDRSTGAVSWSGT